MTEKLEETAICPACNGSGFGVADTLCGYCSGAGGIPELAALAFDNRHSGATSNNPHNFVGQHYWPADHFSVPADTLCLNMAPSPDTDHWCVRPANHPGTHQYEWQPKIIARSWKDAQ